MLTDRPSSKSQMIGLGKLKSILNFVTTITPGLSCMTPKASSLGKTQNSKP